MTTNRQFSKENKEFISACEQANIEPTKRQASKWRLKTGRAWKIKNHISLHPDREDKL